MGHVGQDSQMAVSGSPVVAALVRRSKFQDFLSCVPSPRLLSGPTSLTSPHPLVSHMVCERKRQENQILFACDTELFSMF